ncbi:MAG: RHO alpha subunit C-terminal catalytic domain-containing protein [Asticcacaulis sp.]
MPPTAPRSCCRPTNRSPPTRFRCNTSYWLADGPPGAARDAVTQSLRDLSTRIMAEDAGVCLGVQAGMREAGQARVLLGRPENRIAHFQQAYARHMEAVQ